MGTIYKTLRGVGTGTATITASDGTNSASTEITSAAYEIVPYLYSDAELTQPINGTMLDLSTGHKYVEITVEKDGVPQKMGGDIELSYISFQSFGFDDSEKSEDYNINQYRIESPGPHGGQVVEIYDDSGYWPDNIANFGEVEIFVDISFRHSSNRISKQGLTYSKTTALSNVSVNSGNDFDITGFNLGSSQFAGYIPVSYTEAVANIPYPMWVSYVDDDTTQEPALWCQHYPEDDGSGLGISTTTSDTGRAGSGDIKYAYSDGTQIVEGSIGASVVEQLFAKFDDSSFSIDNGETKTLTGTYTPATLTNTQISAVILLSNYKGVTQNSCIFNGDGTFSLSITGTERNINANCEIYINRAADPTDPDNTNWQPLVQLQGQVLGAGYEMNYTDAQIPVGGTVHIEYQAFDAQNAPILTQSTVAPNDPTKTSVSISNHTFNSATGEGAFDLTGVSLDDWNLIELQVTDPTTSSDIYASISCGVIDGILTIDFNDAAASYTLDSSTNEIEIPFRVTPTTLLNDDVNPGLSFIDNNDNQQYMYWEKNQYSNGEGTIRLWRAYDDQEFTGTVTLSALVSSAYEPTPHTKPITVQEYQPE